MTVITVTGASGFIGKHVVAALRQRPETTVHTFDKENSPADLTRFLRDADVVVHLAGVNRPDDVTEFDTGNRGLTQVICDTLRDQDRTTPVVFTSSIQVELDNPYGVSKRSAESELQQYAHDTGAAAVVFRLSNVFGKWCRPNYNSAVATFCYSIARDLPVTVTDPSRIVPLVYIDDVVRAILQTADERDTLTGVDHRTVSPVTPMTLGDIVERLTAFKAMRTSLAVPDLSSPFAKNLYATYLSYLPEQEFGYDLTQHVDQRGALAEFVKAPPFGQIFVSRTKPGVTRGNHFHHTKTEKFFVVEGQAVIRFRHVLSNEVLEYPVSGTDFRVIDIPPGYTHSIENVGTTDMVVLFWASEPFNPDVPDTYPLNVTHV